MSSTSRESLKGCPTDVFFRIILSVVELDTIPLPAVPELWFDSTRFPSARFKMGRIRLKKQRMAFFGGTPISLLNLG